MGLVHLYYGEGKGKSTAAAGLALRALGAGMQVTLVRLCKSAEPESGEVTLLEKSGARVIHGKLSRRFVSQMDKDEQEATRERQDGILKDILAEIRNDPQDIAGESLGDADQAEAVREMIVFDEALAACNYGLLDEELLKMTVTEGRRSREIVLTGRGPSAWMIEAADYVTEFRCEKHPYERGILARQGIEY